MTHVELNALPHRTVEELAAISSVSLKSYAKWAAGTVHTIYAPEPTADGFTGCPRDPRNGNFLPRKAFRALPYVEGNPNKDFYYI